MFEVAGPLNYRNALAQECRGLERLGSSAEFVFENPQGGQLCRGDRVRVLDSRDTSPIRIQAATLCILGDFVAVPR
jgi:hypothetical protein